MNDTLENASIFEIKSPPPGVSPEELLSNRGWFYMNEVFQVLDEEDTGKYKLAFKLISRLQEQGQDPFQVMGRKKFGGRVAILMERFAPWYNENLLLKTLKLDGSETFQIVLARQDCFYRLSELCKFYSDFLPYTYSILKRTADKCDNPGEEIGVFKFDTTYLVIPLRFEQWLREQILN